MSKLLIISFDAIASDVWENTLARYRNAATFAGDAETVLGVESIFLTNTYPIHCSVATGKMPGEHGVYNNVSAFPEPHPKWTTQASAIKAPTLWQAAASAGLRVAAVLWPCTGGSPHISYNIPEIPPVPGQNQIRANLKAGTKLLQLNMLFRYGKLLNGIKQPDLDNFVTTAAADILRRKKPDLTLVHFTCGDAFGHEYGRNLSLLEPAYKALDENLGRLIEAAGEETAVIVFSDHACLDVHTEITPNDVLVDMGLLVRKEGLYEPGAGRCYFECCGGSAFFQAGSLLEGDIGPVRKRIAGLEGFSRFLTEEEMRGSGRAELSFGFGLKQGFAAYSYPSGHKGDHGYPVDTPDYKVFYAVKGKGYEPGAIRYGGSLLDLAPIAAGLLDIDWR